MPQKFRLDLSIKEFLTQLLAKGGYLYILKRFTLCFVAKILDFKALKGHANH
jgi:hypothetical protein